MTYVCPVPGCGTELSEHGTAGMTCAYGHHFLRADVEGKASTVRRVRGRKVRVAPWVPGAVIGGLALLIEVAGWVI